MPVMTAPSDPGERRLERPPSDRYTETAEAAAAEPTPTVTGSVGRAVAAGVAIALAGALVTILLGGVLALSAGLLVVWAATGNIVGQAMKALGGAALAPPTRPIVAAAVAVGGVVVGALGLWWYAGLEGGVLSPLDYLGQTFGVVIPVQAVLAAGFAWWAAR
jgi:hypothetical protein